MTARNVRKDLMSEDWGALALYSAEQRKWTRVGEGLELSIVGRDAKSGATSMFQHVTKTREPQLEAKPHTHEFACQTLVLSGQIQIAFESENHMLKTGDYLRVPPGVPHVQTLISDDAVMFVTTEGNPGIKSVPGPWSSK